MKLHKKNNTIQFEWVMSFILILIIPLTAWMYLYNKFDSIAENNTKKYTDLLIKSSVNNIEKIVNDVYLNTVQIADDRYIQQAMDIRGEFNVRELVDSGYVSEKLRQSTLIYPVIQEIYLYFPQSDMCIFKGSIMESKYFYESFYGGNEQDYNQWKANLISTTKFRQKKETITSGGNSDEYISFIQTLPFASKQIKAVCVSSVRQNNILESFLNSQSMQDNHVQILITDENGECLLGDSEILGHLAEDETNINRKKINKEWYYLNKEKIGNILWTIYTVVPEKYVFKDLKNIQVVSIILFFIFVLISVIAIKWLVQYNYKPVKTMLNNIERMQGIEFNKRQNEYFVIERAFSVVNMEKNELLARIESSSKLMEYGFWQRLLFGMITQGEWKQAKNSGWVDFDTDKYIVLLCIIENYQNVFENDTNLDEKERRSIANFIVNNVLSELLNNKVKTVSVELNEGIVFIVNVKDKEKTFTEIENCFNEARAVIEQFCGLIFVMMASAVHNTYVGIGVAFEEAKEAISYKFMSVEGSFIRYDHVRTFTAAKYYYPEEKEQILIKYIKEGNYALAKSVIEGILKFNLKDNNLSSTTAQSLILNIGTSLVKAANKISISSVTEYAIDSNNIINLLQSENLDQLKKSMFELIEKMCEIADSKNSQDIPNRVIEYIANNYMNAQMMIATIADELQLHPTYLSRVFKETTGVGLQEYIVKYRINIAKKLLIENSDMSVDHIAHKVGYESIHTFIRNFKKYENQTPTQYRKSNK